MPITKKLLISIIIPVFNEAAVLPLFLKELKKSLDEEHDFEVIFVNDGSLDDSISILQRFCKRDQRIKLVSFGKNAGQENAILTGLKFCRGIAAIILDSDLQDPPSLIAEMLKKWHKGARIVFPIRKSRQDSLLKIVFSKIFYFTLNLFEDRHIDDRIGSFFLIDRKVIDHIAKKSEKIKFIRSYLQMTKFSKDYLNFEREKRPAGRSHYSLAKMWRLAINAFGISKIDRKVSIEQMIGFFENENIAILGGGVSGMLCAYFLSMLGFRLTIFEKEKKLGGLVRTKPVGKWKTEEYYHHFFKGDNDLISLFSKLGLADTIRWHPSRIGFCHSHRLYPFSTAFDLFRLNFLSLFDRFRLGLGNLFLTLIPLRWVGPHISASSLLQSTIGASNWKTIWRPLFKSKFGNQDKNISASWFLARIKARTFDRSFFKEEMLGYPEGGFDTLLKTLKKALVRQGVIIKTGSEVRSIKREADEFFVLGRKFHRIVSTLSPEILPAILAGLKIPTVKYRGVISVLFEMKKRISPFYWINILDDDLPFCVLVEQTNIADCRNYSRRHLLYAGQYLDTESPFFKSDAKAIRSSYIAHLKKIFPAIERNIGKTWTFRNPYAQPVITTNYKEMPHKTNIKEFYMTSMAHIFPEDRGLNQAVREAEKIARMVLSEKE